MNVDKEILKEFSEINKVISKVPVLSSVAIPGEVPIIDVDAVEKLSSKLAEEVAKVDVTVREVEVVSQKTFRWCLPFLPKFWVSRKEE